MAGAIISSRSPRLLRARGLPRVRRVTAPDSQGSSFRDVEASPQLAQHLCFAGRMTALRGLFLEPSHRARLGGSRAGSPGSCKPEGRQLIPLVNAENLKVVPVDGEHAQDGSSRMGEVLECETAQGSIGDCLTCRILCVGELNPNAQVSLDLVTNSLDNWGRDFALVQEQNARMRAVRADCRQDASPKVKSGADACECASEVSCPKSGEQTVQDFVLFHPGREFIRPMSRQLAQSQSSFKQRKHVANQNARLRRR